MNVRLKIVRAAILRKKSPSQIWKQLQDEGVEISRNTVRYTIARFRTRGHLQNKKRGGRPRQFTQVHMKLLDELMEANGELTSTDLRRELHRACGINFATSTIRNRRIELGWVFKPTQFAQNIRRQNRIKRLIHVRELALTNETYGNVVFTDECSIELENHARITFHKKGTKPKFKGRPKRPYKLHVWAGISKRGATDIVIFEGIMRQELFADILRDALLPFGRKTFPEGFRLMLDNDQVGS